MACQDPAKVEGAIFFVIVIGAAPSIANGLITGVDNILPVLLRAGKVLGAKRFDAFRYVILPAAVAEHEYVHKHADREQRDHRGLHARGVGIVTAVRELLAQRVAGDPADDLAREQAAPRERPALFQPADERRRLERRIRRRYGLVDAAAA